MTITHVMFEKGIFTVTDLQRQIKEKGNIEISVPAVHRMVNKKPAEIKFSTLNAICMALDCEPSDVLVYEKATVANRDIQPLVLESEFKPPKRKKKKQVKMQIKNMPPI